MTLLSTGNPPYKNESYENESGPHTSMVIDMTQSVQTKYINIFFLTIRLHDKHNTKYADRKPHIAATDGAKWGRVW